jgi:hypothetical protein
VDCSQIRELADDCVFGLLEDSQKREIQAHIDSCDACARIIAEARSRREALSAWDVPPADGAADRLLARIRSGRAALPGKYGPLVVRVLAAAAVILAAVVLPMLFMTRQPEVLGYEPQITGFESSFRRQVVQDITIPSARADNSCVVVQLRPAVPQAPLGVLVKLNEGQDIHIAAAGSEGRQTIVLTRQHGLKEGLNLLTMRNLVPGRVEFEVTLVMGSAR